MEIHTVKSGETLAQIADLYSVSTQSIITNNGLESQNKLVIGQSLIILIPKTIHTVKPGESLYQIALMYDTTILALLQNNPYLSSNPNLNAGQQITISYDDIKIGEITVNGYVYPFINREVLYRVLPYLTRLTIFGYGFTEDGELIRIDDQPLINLAYQFKVAPFMLLSSIGDDGNFSSERASLLFENLELQNKVIDQIIVVMKEKGYLGLDVDFEFIPPQDKEEFITFIENITTRLNAEGFSVNVDLAPKTSTDQPGLLYEAHNYAAIGAIANTVLLMTYEWGYTYGPPMAVAPIDQVIRVVDYALTQIPKEKILMGVPNYGYDWLLPYVKGVTAATIIGNQFAVETAARYNVEIQFDETAKSPFFNYQDRNGFEHVAWFEDVRSIQAKLDVVTDKGLLGIGYWNTMRPFAQNWAYLNARYVITKVIE